jgi:hypothetical protein
MTLERRVGLGYTLSVDPTGGTTFAVLGSIVDAIDGPDAKKDDIDISILADIKKFFSPGQLDAGVVTFQIAYDPADTDTHTLATLLNSTSTTLANWKINHSGTSNQETFLGYVNGFARKTGKGKLVVADVSIKVSGDTGYKTS